MKIYIIAGEASGDLHGSNLMKAIRLLRPDAQIRCWGGDLMQAAGGEVVKHYRDLAFMGFWEVVSNLKTILRNLRFCKEDILAFQPDVVVFIDYPGFNLRIAKWLRKQSALSSKIVYYISPQLWAWHVSRVHDIRRDVDEMLVILPFEAEFYKKYEVPVYFVGHPLLDAVDAFRAAQAGTLPAEQERPVIALLPGSRKQEVRRILPVMLSVARYFPEYHFVVAAPSAMPAAYFAPFLKDYPEVELVQGATYEVLNTAHAALVKSGTSTLETALFGVPQVVCYAGNPLSYQIAKRVIQVKYISLVNLIADAPVVQELIQDELNTAQLHKALQAILQPAAQAEIQAAYRAVRQQLGDSGASLRAARVVVGEG